MCDQAINDAYDDDFEETVTDQLKLNEQVQCEAARAHQLYVTQAYMQPPHKRENYELVTQGASKRQRVSHKTDRS